MRWDNESLDPLHLEHIILSYRTKSGKYIIQVAYTRQGVITPGVEYVAVHRNMNYGELGIDTHTVPEFVCRRMTEGRTVLPANVNHPEAEPVIIGHNSLTKVNAGIGNSATTSNTDEEAKEVM